MIGQGIRPDCKHFSPTKKRAKHCGIRQVVQRARSGPLQKPCTPLKSDRLDRYQTSPAAIMSIARQAQEPLKTLVEHSQAIVRHLAVPPADWWGFCDLIDKAARLQTIKRREHDKRDALQKDFGGFFKDRNTAWDDVLAALTWCSDLFQVVDGRINDRLRAAICAPELPIDPVTSATAIQSLCSSYSHGLHVLDARFDASACPWGAWASGTV